MKKHQLFLCLIVPALIFGCNDREPRTKYELNNPVNSVSCINCKEYTTNGGLYKFSTIQTTMDITKGKIDKVADEAYLKVYYNFVGYKLNPTTDYFVIPKRDITLNNSSISYESEWHFGNTSGVNITIELYTGKGMKSAPYSYTINKPAGAD